MAKGLRVRTLEAVRLDSNPGPDVQWVTWRETFTHFASVSSSVHEASNIFPMKQYFTQSLILTRKLVVITLIIGSLMVFILFHI